MAEETYELPAEAAEMYEHTFVPALFREWAQRLVAFAGVTAGQSVLDVACGTGIVARTAAKLAGVQSNVTGVDLNPAMLAVASRIGPHLSWVPGNAAALPFPDSSFDVVLCQAALMFFPAPADALREMGRVAGPGMAAIQVPGRLAESAGYLALTEVVARHAGPEVVRLMRAYFSVGEPDLLSGLFAEAGLKVDKFETWQGATRLDSIETLLAVELLPLAGAVTSDVLQRITDDCRIALEPFIELTGEVALPLEVHLIRARKEGR